MRDYDPPRLQILLVEDNRNFLETLKLLLRTMGFRRFFEAADPAEAMAILQVSEIDAVLIDLKIGASLELVRAIRADYSNIFDIPIVIVTAHAERPYVDAAIEAGANQFLVKPVSATVLRTHLMSAIEGFCPANLPLAAGQPDTHPI